MLVLRFTIIITRCQTSDVRERKKNNNADDYPMSSIFIPFYYCVVPFFLRPRRPERCISFRENQTSILSYFHRQRSRQRTALGRIVFS